MLEGVQREGITASQGLSCEEICRVASLPIAVVNQKGMLKKFQLKKKKKHLLVMKKLENNVLKKGRGETGEKKLEISYQ